MATLEDKLLGEKLHYYCSSSEEESGGEEEKDGNASEQGERSGSAKKSGGLKFIPDSGAPVKSDMRDWEGSSTNTGPKGVIRDWQRYKQLEAEKRENQEKERIALTKKLAATCTSHLDDEKEKQALQNVPVELDDGDDEVLREFRERRMKELMLQERTQTKTYGRVFEIDSAAVFLSATEKDVTDLLVVLLYEDRAAGCAAMKNSLQYLASEYTHVKFAQVKASQVNLSPKFKAFGLPALLAYKNGDLIGNYVQLVKEFGEEMYPTDIESYLIEHGILQDKTLVPSILRSSVKAHVADDDSD